MIKKIYCVSFDCKSCVHVGCNSESPVWRSTYCHYAAWRWYRPRTHELCQGGVQVQDGAEILLNIIKRIGLISGIVYPEDGCSKSLKNIVLLQYKIWLLAADTL
jgi:hypothetical protein